MKKLDGKVAIVTGASRGIGKGIAQLFAAEGAKVVCAARTLNEGKHIIEVDSSERRLEGSLDSTVSEIQQAGGTALAVKTDVSDEESCTQLIETATQAFGPVDVLINNAVMDFPQPIKDYPTKLWVHCFAVNVHGPIMLIQKVLPDMIKIRSGAIVNISSAAATGPGRGPYTESGRGMTLYGSTKAALERFTQGLAQEVYQYGIKVSALAPSTFVSTPTTKYLFHDTEGEPVEWMAKAAILLTTEPLDKVTGRVVYSQAILKEYGLIDDGKGPGIERPGSGYSQI